MLHQHCNKISQSDPNPEELQIILRYPKNQDMNTLFYPGILIFLVHQDLNKLDIRRERY